MLLVAAFAFALGEERLVGSDRTISFNSARDRATKQTQCTGRTPEAAALPVKGLRTPGGSCPS